MKAPKNRIETISKRTFFLVSQIFLNNYSFWDIKNNPSWNFNNFFISEFPIQTQIEVYL